MGFGEVRVASREERGLTAAAGLMVVPNGDFLVLKFGCAALANN